MATKYRMTTKQTGPVMPIKQPISGPQWGSIAAPVKTTPLKAAVAGAISGRPASPSASAMVPAGGSSAPIDPQLDAELGSANRNRSQALVALGAERASLGSNYGFGVNAAGGVYDDPSNPFSRAAVMQLLIDQSKTGAATSMGARGQLYSGAFQDEQNRITTQGQRSRDALIREFLSASGGITQRELSASNAFDDATTAARGRSLERTLANRPDPASVKPYVAPTAAKPDYKSVSGKDSKGRAGAWHVYPDGRKVFVRG